MQLKKFLTTACTLIICMESYSYTPLTLPVIPPDPAIEKKVRKTLDRMTLDEKIGQMTQLQVDMIGDYDSNGRFSVSEEKMKSVFGTYKVGSILNTPSRTCLDPAEWNRIISEIQAY